MHIHRWAYVKQKQQKYRTTNGLNFAGHQHRINSIIDVSIVNWFYFHINNDAISNLKQYIIFN